MTPRTVITCIFVLCLSAPLFYTAHAQVPDTLWTQTYGGGEDDIGSHVQITGDGGCILAGYSLSYGSGSYDGLLVKTDADGNEEWASVPGGIGDDLIHSVRETQDGGYVFTGFTNSYGSGGNDLWLMKVDSLGMEVWQHTYGGGDDDAGHYISPTNDGGFIIGGETCSYGAGNRDFWLVKVDAAGNLEWDRTFGGLLIDYCHGAEQTYDGGYILVGTTESYGSGEYDYWLIKTDADGNEEWSRTFGGPLDDSAHGVHQTEDGGYILGGCTWSYGAGGCDFWLIKTDFMGEEEWNYVFGGINCDCCYAVQETTDGGFVLAGWAYSYGAGECDFWVVKTDFSGNELWNCTFGGTGFDHGQNIQQTGDGGYVLTGHTTSYGAGAIDVWLVRLSGPPVYVTATPLNPPISIPVSGGAFEFTVDVRNNTTSTQNFDVWTDVTLPAGGSFGPIMLRTGLALPPDRTLSRQLLQNVGANSPAGEYRYNVHAGVHPDSVISTSSFPFVKLSSE